jgi:hypothetical protein
VVNVAEAHAHKSLNPLRRLDYLAPAARTLVLGHFVQFRNHSGWLMALLPPDLLRCRAPRGLFDKSSNRLRLRHVHGVAALNLDNS